MKNTAGAVYNIFLLVLSVYVLIIVFAETFLIADPEIRLVLQYIDFSICLVFLFDFALNLYRAENKREYMKWGWIDLLSSIPMADPLRWGRLAKVVRILRFLRTLKSLRVLIRSIQESKIQSLTLIVLLITFLAYTLCASLILEFERAAGGTITTANEALWWAFLNIMNAKISVTQAVSSAGLICTVVLNKVGILLFAYLNAIIITWLIQKKQNAHT